MRSNNLQNLSNSVGGRILLVFIYNDLQWWYFKRKLKLILKDIRCNCSCAMQTRSVHFGIRW